MRLFTLIISRVFVFALIVIALSAPFTPNVEAQCRECPRLPVEPPRDPPRERDPGANVPPPTSVPQPTVAPQPTATPQPTSVPQPTTAPQPTSVPQPTTAPQPTSVPPILLPAPAPTVEPTSVAIPSVPPSPVPTAAPAIPKTYSNAIVLNEYSARALNRDWNGDGAINADDAWIELYNSGDAPVDLSGWQIAHTANSGGAFIIPAGTIIAPHGFLVFYRGQTKLTLDDKSDVVQLIYPSGALADSTNHRALKENQVYARSVDGAGVWVTECVATPNKANCPVVAGTYFREHIASPAQFGNLNIAVLVTNILLAIILALAMGFFSNLLNDILETHEDRFGQFLAPLRAVLSALQRASAGFDAVMKSLRLSWIGFAIKLAFVLVLYGIVFAYLDPSFNIGSEQGWLLILALALSAGIIGVIDDVAQYIVLRWRGARGVIRIHGGNFLLAIVSALFSRLSGLTPGLLLGNPAGIEEMDDPDFEIPSHLLALGTIGGAAVIAWLITPFTDPDAWWHTALLLIFAMGVQTVFFEMLPLKYLHGRGIFEFNRWLWIGAFALITTIFFQTMLNPDGDFIRAFDQPNMVILALIVLVFCVGTTALWFYMQRAPRAPARE